MNKFQRNMTVSAAALVAALVMAPKSEAQGRERSHVETQARGSGRQEGRGIERRHELRENRSDRGRSSDRRDFSPAPRYRGVAPRPYAGFRGNGYRYGNGYSAFRSFGGIRFYSYCPSPGYVYISDGDYEGWVEPPYLGAIWLPSHYDQFGIWCGGHWR